MAPPLGGAYERTPMLFLTGELDTMIPASGVRALAERYPLAEVHTLPDTEHLQGIRREPETYAETVLGFLERTLKDSTSGTGSKGRPQGLNVAGSARSPP
ncbi:hypothetical protein SANTM175S_05742 [Streptomyces antimycoticus]